MRGRTSGAGIMGMGRPASGRNLTLGTRHGNVVSRQLSGRLHMIGRYPIADVHNWRHNCSMSERNADDQWQDRWMAEVYQLGVTLAAMQKDNPWPGDPLLPEAINYLMTELWDRGFSQTEIREALDAAIHNLPLYAAGEEVRPCSGGQTEIHPMPIMRDAKKPTPWKMGVGVAIGLLIGVLVWWSAYVPSLGLLQNPNLVLAPSSLGIVIVSFRNWLKKVGPYAPETIARNRRGRI